MDFSFLGGKKKWSGKTKEIVKFFNSESREYLLQINLNIIKYH